MASRKVIQDSDDDCDGDATLDISPAKTEIIIRPSILESPVTTASMIQTSSTDPVLFRDIYEQHLGAVLEHSFERPLHEESPIADLAHEVHMSSSNSCSQRLKRSKSTNISSSTSISESMTLNRKTKRRKSTRDVDDSIQITLSRASENITEEDPWAFPNSSFSNESPELKLKVRSSKISQLKTYSRSIRRSQTVAYSSSSPIDEWTLQGIVEHDINITNNLKATLGSQHGGTISTESSNPKRLRKSTSESEDFLNNRTVASVSPASIDVLYLRMDTVNTNGRLATSDQDSQIGSKSFSNDVYTGIETGLLGPLNRTAYTLTCSANQDSITSKSPVVIIPDSLTEAQKSQYQLIGLESSHGSRQSSQLETIDIDAHSIFMDDSNTASNEKIMPPQLVTTAQPLASAVSLSSTQTRVPDSAADHKVRRAKSEMMLQKTSPIVSKSTSKATKRLKRNKTFAHNETLRDREVSADELSFTPSRSETTASKQVSIRKTKRKDFLEDGVDRVDMDELFGTDEIGVSVENHQSWPSARRSKSMLVQPPDTLVDDDLRKSRQGRKRKKHTDEARGALHLSNANSFEETNASIDISLVNPGTLDTVIIDVEKEHYTQESEDLANLQNIAAKSKVAECSLPVSTVAAQPKRRGRPRKRTSELIPNEVDNFSKIHSTESNTTLSSKSNKELIVLQETNQTDVPVKGSSSLSLTYQSANTADTTIDNCLLNPEDAIDSTPVQTPKREMKRGPDQHSPLQNGKVSYRVGLSKKTRIAPLLKVIRKP